MKNLVLRLYKIIYRQNWKFIVANILNILSCIENCHINICLKIKVTTVSFWFTPKQKKILFDILVDILLFFSKMFDSKNLKIVYKVPHKLSIKSFKNIDYTYAKYFFTFDVQIWLKLYIYIKNYNFNYLLLIEKNYSWGTWNIFKKLIRLHVIYCCILYTYTIMF